MQVKQTSSEKLKRSYAVTIPNSTIEEKMNAKLAAISKTAKIKGFRAGKVPLEVVRKQYGNAIKGEVLEQVVNETSKQALQQENVTPAVPPKIEITEFKDGKDLIYSMEIELFPDVPQIEYSKIEIEKLEIEQSEDDIDEAMKRLAERSTHWHALPAGAAAKKDNAVKIDFEGFLGDKAFDGGKGQNYTLALGSNQFIPGFEDQLVGVKAGEARTVNVKFPEQYHSADLAGKDARFEVKVKEVLESHTGHLDDEFAKEFGAASLEDLRNKMREQLAKDQESFVRMKMKEQIFNKLYDEYRFEAPESMLDVEFNSIWQQVMQDKSRGLPTDLDNADEEKVREEYKELANRRVALGIMLSTISKRDNVEVSNQDIINAINERASQFPGQEQQVTEYFQKNPRAIQELAGPLLEEKVVDFLIGKVKLKTKKTTMKELIAQEEMSANKSASKKSEPQPDAKKKKVKKS